MSWSSFDLLPLHFKAAGFQRRREQGAEDLPTRYCETTARSGLALTRAINPRDNNRSASSISPELSGCNIQRQAWRSKAHGLLEPVAP